MYGCSRKNMLPAWHREAALRFLRHEGLQSKEATAANKAAAVAKNRSFYFVGRHVYPLKGCPPAEPFSV